MDFLANLWIILMALFGLVIVAAIAIVLMTGAVKIAYEETHCEHYEECLFPDKDTGY